MMWLCLRSLSQPSGAGGRGTRHKDEGRIHLMEEGRMSGVEVMEQVKASRKGVEYSRSIKVLCSCAHE